MRLISLNTNGALVYNLFEPMKTNRIHAANVFLRFGIWFDLFFNFSQVFPETKMAAVLIQGLASA